MAKLTTFKFVLAVQRSSLFLSSIHCTIHCPLYQTHTVQISLRTFLFLCNLFFSPFPFTLSICKSVNTITLFSSHLHTHKNTPANTYYTYRLLEATTTASSKHTYTTTTFPFLFF